jgi:hypothetical protein
MSGSALHNHREVVMDPVSYLFSAYLNLVAQQVPFSFLFWQSHPAAGCLSS